MTGKPLRVLFVEDSENDVEMVVWELTRGGYDLDYARVETADAMSAALAGATWDIVLSDFSMPEFSGPAALALLKASPHDLPFIIISGTIGEETAVSALRAGAHDFLVKGRLARLLPAVERELGDAAERRERRSLEAQLRQAQKMEGIGQLAGGIAHDFNNMLTAILGYAQLLLQQVGPDDVMGDDLREIVAAGERAAALTRQLLAFSRKQALVLAPLDLTSVVHDLEPMLRRLIGESIIIETRLANPLDSVLADATQLDQVLMNLCVNARDAMPQGGLLTLDARNTELDEAFARAHQGVNAGSYVVLTVTDTGMGMDPAVQAQIFEPFFTTKERGRGTGLGLAAVYGIVKQLGGVIDVDSELGHGTTFRIYLPKTTRHLGAGPSLVRTTTAPSAGHETILLVEDEASVRQFTKSALQRDGYRVVEAESAEAALTLLETMTGPLDLLLTDVILPGMDGRELAARIRRAHPRVRVLFISGYAGWSKTPDSLLHEGVELLEKPFTSVSLGARIRQLLGADVT